MKVYVIITGVYSDWCIVGVTETEEEAKQICKAISHDDDRWTDNVYYLEFDTKQFKTSKLRFVVEYDGRYWPKYDKYDDFKLFTETSEIYEDFWVVYADTEEQAEKIAQDMRAERLAKEAGVV